MRVLVACAESGTVADALHQLGHDVMSCDLKHPSQTRMGVPHYQGDVMDVIDDGWDAMLAFPECRLLAKSGLRWLYKGGKRWNEDGSENPRNEQRWADMIEAAAFFRKLLDAPIPVIAVENSDMHPYAVREIGENATQIVQPYWFGVKETKALHLWIKGTRKRLVATDFIEPPEPRSPERKAWEKCFRMPPDKPGQEGRRAKLRARTQPEVAMALATQLIGIAKRKAA